MTKGYQLLHIPKSREIEINGDPGKTYNKKDLEKFLAAHEIYYLKAQDAYICYEKSRLAEIKIPVTDFISNSGGYHIQRCEIEFLEVK